MDAAGVTPAATAVFFRRARSLLAWASSTVSRVLLKDIPIFRHSVRKSRDCSPASLARVYNLIFFAMIGDSSCKSLAADSVDGYQSLVHGRHFRAR
jgi:hypothetical protein